MKHRVAVTVSEPDHPAVSMRKETKEKFVRVTADSKDEAVAKAKAHYKKQGYKVHGAEYHSEIKEELELDEAIKLNTKVRIHAPGKDYHDKVGHVGEIRHGAYKGAPKTYTVDYDGKSVQLDKKNIKVHKEEIELDEAQITHSKVAKLMGDTKTRGEAIEKVKKTFKCSHEEACKHVDAVMDKAMKEEVEQIDELSIEKLAAYKKKAGEQASQANKEGDIKKADKRFSGIIKATNKQFTAAVKKEETDLEEAAKGVLHKVHVSYDGQGGRASANIKVHAPDKESAKRYVVSDLTKKGRSNVIAHSARLAEERKSDPVPSVYAPTSAETKGTYHIDYHGKDKDGNKQTKTYKVKANDNHHAQSKAMKIARSEFPHHLSRGASTTKFFKEELEKFSDWLQEASCGNKVDMIKNAVKKMREEVEIEDEVEQLEEATLAYHVKKASDAKERGDDKKFAYHMENARTARYAMTGKEMIRNRHHLDKYNELRDGK